MPALKLLILDANEVIYLHETGLWQTVLSRCEVFLARTVAEDEAKFYRGTEADEIIDVSVDISAGRVKVFEQTPTELKLFFDGFDPIYLPSLDPGEAESLAYLISSGDAIVFRVLGLLNRSDQGISLAPRAVLRTADKRTLKFMMGVAYTMCVHWLDILAGYRCSGPSKAF